MTLDDRLREAAHEVRALSAAPVPPLSRPASRRRTIRWAAVPAIGLAALLVAALVAVATRGGPTVVAVSPPSASIDAVFRGASISTSIDWHGTVLAAGVIRPQGCTSLPTPVPPSASCQGSGALPVVWSSAGGGGWARTWMGDSAQIVSLRQSAQGSNATETLLDGGDRLFLLSSLTFPAAITPGVPRLEMWESSDAVTWSAVPLPTGLGASTLLAAVYGHDRIVVLAGLPGSSTVWTSADGSSWQSSTAGLSLLSPGGGSLVVTPLGFEIGLRLADPKDAPAVWNSTDALTWEVSPVWGDRGYVTALASGPKVIVAAVAFNDGTSGFYLSTDDGVSWSPASTTTGGLDLTRADVVVTTSGFVATSNGSGLPLWVAPDTGSPWKPVKPNGIPVTRSFLIDDLLETSGGQLIVFGFDQSNSTFDVPWVTSTSSQGGPTEPILPSTKPNSHTPEPASPKVVVTPAEGLHDGQRVEVAVTGFPHIGEKVFLSECASAAVVNSLGCGDQLAGQAFMLTNDQGSGTTSFVINSSAATGPLKAPVVPCSTRCVLEVTIGATSDHPPVYAWSTLNFSTR